ncbi:MAG TPA: gas vesicle protein GvpG [Gemmatimonadaceae bacterium]|nr:gas vesicle protein GvpG [Gemmatimonadaceae bacterium]
MGLLKHVLFWPVTGPAFLAHFALETVQDTVRGELTDDQKIKEELLALQMELELGDIDDAEYVAREAELMRRLREVREWREQFGMGIAGGPVRVARDEAAEDAASTGDEGPRVADAQGGADVQVTLDWDEPSA